jgi:hypothetical protein
VRNRHDAPIGFTSMKFVGYCVDHRPNGKTVDEANRHLATGVRSLAGRGVVAAYTDHEGKRRIRSFDKKHEAIAACRACNNGRHGVETNRRRASEPRLVLSIGDDAPRSPFEVLGARGEVGS